MTQYKEVRVIISIIAFAITFFVVFFFSCYNLFGQITNCIISNLITMKMKANYCLFIAAILCTASFAQTKKSPIA